MRRPRSDPFAPRRGPGERMTAPEAMEARSRRNRAVFTPPTFVQRPDTEEYGTGRQPFQMRRAPGFQELGDPEQIHTSKGEVQAEEAKRLARDAANAAIEGRCDQAMHLLHRAHGHIGAAVAHSGSGGSVELGTTSTTLERASAYVGKHCKVTPRKGRK